MGMLSLTFFIIACLISSEGFLLIFGIHFDKEGVGLFIAVFVGIPLFLIGMFLGINGILRFKGKEKINIIKDLYSVPWGNTKRSFYSILDYLFYFWTILVLIEVPWTFVHLIGYNYKNVTNSL